MNRKLTFKWSRSKLKYTGASFAVLLLLFLALSQRSIASGINNIPLTASDTTGLTVHGTVTDLDGQGISGVNVKVNETNKGVITDGKGKFMLQGVAENDVLIFSSVGYQSQEIKVAGQSEISIALVKGTQTMEEVVVMGYGKQKKKLVTGATVEIKSEDIQKRTAVSPLAAIQGQAPGVSLTSTGGQPGGTGFRISIRGAGTVGSTTPLFIVDGVQTGDISYLNPSDIASVDILKDAASAAIYGARAANGVIFITTKTGKAGHSQISFDGFYGVQNLSKKLKVLNGRDYINMMNEMYTNSNLVPVYSDEAVNEKILQDVQGGTDWMDLLMAKNVPIQSYSLSGQGGTEKSTYALSLSSTEQGGIVGGSDLSNYRRITFRINSEHKVYKDILKMGQHLSYSHIKTRGTGYPIIGAIRTPPIIPNMNPEDPSKFYYNNVPGAGGDNTLGLWSTEITNPYASMLTNSNSIDRINKIVGDVYLELQIFRDLRFRTTLSMDYSAQRGRSYQPLRPNLSAGTNALTAVTQASQSATESLTLTSENTLNYTTTINGVHKIDALAGMSALKTNTEYLSASNKNLLYEGMDYAWLNNATGTASAGTMSMSGYPEQDAILSYFGRVNYDYKGKYLASVILRSDGSSRFDKNYRRGYFPSFSAGWNISNEPFLADVQWLTYLKLRGSWGQNGNMNIPPYFYLALVGPNFPYAFGDDGTADVGASLTNLGNPTLNWEKAQSTNIGFDASLFKGKLGITFDVYNRTTKDWLVRANIPTIYGVSGPYINGGNVTNKGVELALNYSNFIGQDFNYTISGNIAFNKNRVGGIPTQDGILHGGGGTLYANSVEVTRSQDGFPLGYFWGLVTDGVFQNTDEINNYKGTNGAVIQPNARPGDLRYVDRNGDGTISALDKTMIGHGQPDAIFGLTLSLAYKNFDFYVATNGVAGNQILQNYIDANRNYWNITQDLYDARWHGEGTSNKYPRVDAQNTNWINFSDVFLYKGDYLKINNVTLGYDFAKSLLKLKGLTQLRLYVTGQNLYNFTSYNGMDPEVGTGSNGVDQSEIGRDSGMYPHARTILFGLNVKF